MKFSRWLFIVACVYGLIVMLPQYFAEASIGRDYPPPITHPEFFYGFVGVGIAWQILFLVIAGDPGRYRLCMLPAALEKVTFGVAAIVLFAQGRFAPLGLGFAVIDLVFATLFVIAFVVTGRLAAFATSAA